MASDPPKLADSMLEPKPKACVAMNADGPDTQPPSSTTSCCFHPDLKKWYPYDTLNGWDLTQECANLPDPTAAVDS